MGGILICGGMGFRVEPGPCSSAAFGIGGDSLVGIRRCGAINPRMCGGSTGGVAGCGATKLRLTISLAAPPGISRELLATGSLDTSLVSASIPTGFLVLMKRLRGAGAGAGGCTRAGAGAGLVGPGMMESWVELPGPLLVDDEGANGSSRASEALWSTQ